MSEYTYVELLNGDVSVYKLKIILRNEKTRRMNKNRILYEETLAVKKLT